MSPEFHVFLLALEDGLWRRHALAVKFKQRTVALVLLSVVMAVTEARKKVSREG